MRETWDFGEDCAKARARSEIQHTFERFLEVGPYVRSLGKVWDKP